MSRGTEPRPLTCVAVLLLLAVLFAQLLGAATSLSATVDEGFHITSGYEYLRTGRLRLFDEHAPLAKALFAWPLFFVRDLMPPDRAPDYGSGDLIAVTQQTTLAYRPITRVFAAPRVAAALLTVVLAAAIYRCAAGLAGGTAGLLALTVCVFDPNFVAHGSLATTDMGAAAFSFWAIWAGSRWIARPSVRRWALATVLMGMAQAAKLTALLVYPVLGVAALIAVATNWRKPGALLLRYAAMVAASGLVLWALYGFEVRPSAGVLGGSVPLPAMSHFERAIRLSENLEYGRESFLLGQNRMHGWALYFPVALLVKTPLPILLLAVWACAAAVWTRAMRHRGRLVPEQPAKRTRMAMLLFPLLYALASLTSSLNIGYRHLLPLLPFAYVGIAVGIVRLAPATSGAPGRRPWLTMAGLGILLVWLVWGTVGLAPDYLMFFNEVAGGPDEGWRFLADSNTDWGQTFAALAHYQEEAGLGTVKLSTFTFYDPAAYGVAYEPISPMTGVAPVLSQRLNPEAGVYAISATTLDGVPLADPATFDWFRHREPFAQIGHAMLLYDIEPLDGTWLAQCSTPVAPLSAEAAREGLGIADLRSLNFDCTQSWVVPSAASGAGWYSRAIDEQTRLRWPQGDRIGADLLPAWLDGLALEDLALSYVQPRDGALPAFAMWACDGCTVPRLESANSLQGVVSFHGFLAPATARAGTTVDILTLWTVLEPPAKPLSLMLHLRDAGGTPVAVADGLGYPVEQWHAGDRLVQRHRLEIPDGIAGEYGLHTGAYWLDTLEPLRGESLVQALVIE